MNKKQKLFRIIYSAGVGTGVAVIIYSRFLKQAVTNFLNGGGSNEIQDW